MSIFQAFIFGLLQGVTEFLPVSSSAHLKIAKMFFGIDSSESQVLFDLACHFGTLIVVLFFLKEEIFKLFHTEKKKLGYLLLATLPLIPCYFLLKPLRDFASTPQYLGFCLMLTGGILFLGQKLRIPVTQNKHLRDALWIGTLQSAALIPGISRSASTISCARVLGWEPKEAVRFSFLLSIPTILGGNCLELLKLTVENEEPISISFSACAIGFLTACSAGFIVIRFALSILEKGHLKPFAWYCLSLGALLTLYLNLGSK